MKKSLLTLYCNDMCTFSRHRESNIKVDEQLKPPRSTFPFQHFSPVSLNSPRCDMTQRVAYLIVCRTTFSLLVCCQTLLSNILTRECSSKSANDFIVVINVLMQHLMSSAFSENFMASVWGGNTALRSRNV